jgi:hypothetical protein
MIGQKVEKNRKVAPGFLRRSDAHTPSSVHAYGQGNLIEVEGSVQ